MRNVSKIIYPLFFTFVLFLFFLISTKNILAQVPEILLSCDQTRENEFHSLRPYQAAPCGNAPQALFCSNKLVIFESFKLDNECKSQKTGCQNCDWTCNLSYKVEPHNLNITLDESEFPILGNTEDEFDDATKMNEYASWYLNGVIDKRENKDATDEQIVNFSGPVKKLIPYMIQDRQRIEVIESAEKIATSSPQAKNPSEEDESTEGQPENHNQLVVDNLRLSDWSDGNLSIVNTFFNWLGTDVWDKKYPPLPWQFKSEIYYKKAYNEWQGKNCAILPIFGLQCLDTWVSNKWADLWHYVPLSNNSDQKGKNYLLTGDGPNYVPSQGTEIDNQQHKSYRNAPLYFAHTKEVNDLSNLLNTTYQPSGYESEKLPETTEQIKKGVATKDKNNLEGSSITGTKESNTLATHDPYGNLDCSAVNVRTNEGDDLFPGDRKDGKELYVEGVEYEITKVECHEENRRECLPIGPNPEICTWRTINILNCPAQVGIEFKLGTQTPYANEIFSQTVADSGSTFRKIFPKVEEGAPVECIADIPTTTNVTYSIENDLNEKPNGGEQEFKETVYPADGSNSGTQLTFPHIGSVYEYFLNGIQTALRPKGYGSPIANGNCKTNEPIECGDWEDKILKSSGGSCGICNAPIGDLAKRILATAGTAYNVPAANIWAAMKHEGADGYQGITYDFSDENVRKWSTPVACGGEPMPGCNNDVDTTQPPFGFLSKWFYLGDGDNALWTAVQKIDPNRNSKDLVSRCNFLDAAFATAKLLRQGSSNTSTSAGMSCGSYKFDTTQPASCNDWSDIKIAQSQVGHMGQCPETSPYGPVQFKIQDVVDWYHAASCK